MPSNSFNNSRTQTSIRTLQLIMLAFSLMILGRAFYLQVMEYEVYSALGKQNSIRQEYVNPARGLIYDRNGILIVDNQPIFSLTVIPSNFDRSTIPYFASLLGVSDSLITERIDAAQSYSWHRSSKIITEIDFATFSNIQENIWKLPGIGHQIDSKRHYPTDMKASHILGFLREADPIEYQQSEDLRLGDKIGKSGLEMTYENNLRGKLGLQYLRVNAMGQHLGDYEDESINTPPIPGDDIITTLDYDLQLLAEDLMKGKSGAVVAMDPQNGAILAMASSPVFDLSRLAGHLDQQYWTSINTDSAASLFNRAVSGRQPPGSTFKPLMGIVGMQLGIVTPETEIYNSGAYVRGRSYGDTAPIGNYNLESAITHSSNTYFFALMDRIATQGKLNEWSALVKDFGLGQANLYDLPNQSNGIIPDSTYLNSRFGYRNWSLGDIINFGVGQGLVSVSPLQVALMTSSIANGGYKVQPHLVQAIRVRGEKLETRPIQREKISWVKDSYLDVVKKGMRGVVTTGSGRFYANIPGIEVAGKTGTAQNPHGRDHGWFTSFAPLNSPQIVVTVLIENGGYGSVSAAPIAALLIEQYLTGEIKRQNVYNYVKNFAPRPTASERQAGVTE